MQLTREQNKYIITHADKEAVACKRPALMKIIKKDTDSTKYKTFRNFCVDNSVDVDDALDIIANTMAAFDAPENQWDNIMAKKILSHHTLIYIDLFDEWYIYNADLGFYKNITKTTVKGVIKDYLDVHHLFDHRISEGYETMKIKAEMADPTQMNNYPEILNIKNGILDRSTLILSPHSSEYIFTYRMEVEYHESPVATPTWDRYMTETPESSEMINIFLNGLFLGKRDNEFMLWLVGPPNSGKSALITLLQHIFKEAGLSSTSLSSLGGSFALQNLMSNYMNIDADVNESSFGSATVSNFKKLLDTDAIIDVNRKHAKQITMQWNGFMLGASNNLPTLPQNTDIRAVMKRVAYVRFPHIFPNNKVFKDNLLSEIDDIFSQIIQRPFTSVKDDVESWIAENQNLYYTETNHIFKILNAQYKTEYPTYAPYGTKCSTVYTHVIQKAREIGVTISPYHYIQLINVELMAMGAEKRPFMDASGRRDGDFFYGLRLKGVRV